MNVIFQTIKTFTSCFLLLSLITACGKNDPNIIEHSSSKCDHVTINITNSLDKTITDLFVDEVEVGKIKSGETVVDICFDQITTDGGVYPYLNLIGNYDGQTTGQLMIICGTGLLTEYDKTYNIDINSVVDNVFIYTYN